MPQFVLEDTDMLCNWSRLIFIIVSLCFSTNCLVTQSREHGIHAQYNLLSSTFVDGAIDSMRFGSKALRVEKWRNRERTQLLSSTSSKETFHSQLADQGCCFVCETEELTIPQPQLLNRFSLGDVTPSRVYRIETSGPALAEKTKPTTRKPNSQSNMQFEIDMTYANRLPADPFDEDRTLPMVAVLPMERMPVENSKPIDFFQNVFVNLDDGLSWGLSWQISRVVGELHEVNRKFVHKLMNVYSKITDWHVVPWIQTRSTNNQIESIEQYDSVADRVLQKIVDGKSNSAVDESEPSLDSSPISQASTPSESKQTIIVIFQFNQVISPSESTRPQHSLALHVLDFFFKSNRQEAGSSQSEWFEREIFDATSEDPYWTYYAELAKNGILFPLKPAAEADHQSQSVVKIHRGNRSTVSYSAEVAPVEKISNGAAFQTWLMLPTKSAIKKFKTMSEHFPAGSQLQLMWINFNTHLESCWSDNLLFNVWQNTFSFSKERMSQEKPKNNTQQPSSRSPIGTALIPKDLYRAIGTSILKLMWINLDARKYQPNSLIL